MVARTRFVHSASRSLVDRLASESLGRTTNDSENSCTSSRGQPKEPNHKHTKYLVGRACRCCMRRGHQCDQKHKHKHGTCGAMHAHWSKTGKKRQKERMLECFHSDQGNNELRVDLEVHALVDALNPALAVLLETTQNLSTSTNSQRATQPYLGVSSNLDSRDMLPNAKLQEERIWSHALASCSLHRTVYQPLSPNTAAFTSTHALAMDELTSSDKSIEPCAHTAD
jgi:hypothetical protein